MNELIRPSATATSRKTSYKFKLNCQSKLTTDNPTTKDWLTVIKHISDEHPVLKGVLEKRKEVVVKYGKPSDIQKDYVIAESLSGLSNFLKYYCTFTCEDDLSDLRRRPYLCDPSAIAKQPYGFIVMPYFPLGSMMEYRWDRGNFELMKSTVKQVCFAMLQAFEKHGMVHRDLHTGNVMLRRTKKVSVTYGSRALPTAGMYPIIIDFGRSDTSQTSETHAREVYDDIRRVITGLEMLENSDISLFADIRPIASLSSANAPVTDEAYQTVSDVVDRIKILYDKSKIPKNPF